VGEEGVGLVNEDKSDVVVLGRLEEGGEEGLDGPTMSEATSGGVSLLYRTKLGDERSELPRAMNLSWPGQLL